MKIKIYLFIILQINIYWILNAQKLDLAGINIGPNGLKVRSVKVQYQPNFYKSGSTWITTETFYDENYYHKTKHIIYYNDTLAGVYIYIYDTVNLLSKTEYYAYNQQLSGTPPYTEFMYYDQDNKLIKSVTDYTIEKYGKKDYFTLFSYDEKGRLIEEKEIVDTNEIRTTRYNYDALNILTEKQEYWLSVTKTHRCEAMDTIKYSYDKLEFIPNKILRT